MMLTVLVTVFRRQDLMLAGVHCRIGCRKTATGDVISPSLSGGRGGGTLINSYYLDVNLAYCIIRVAPRYDYFTRKQKC